MTPTAVPSVAPQSSLGGTVGIVGTECQLDEAGLLVGIQVMELDYRVGVCFAENVRVEGNARLWADGFEMEMTEESRALSESPARGRCGSTVRNIPRRFTFWTGGGIPSWASG